MPRTVAEVFDAVLAVDPDREALVTRSGRWSYAELDRWSDRAAHALHALGVRPGDRVAGALPNELDVIIAFHGAMRLGAVWVGVNRALAPPEMEYVLHDCGASLLLADPATTAVVPPTTGVRTVAIDTDTPGEWHDALAATPDAPFEATIDPHAPAGIAYTSGTTGHPKGAVHSQHNLLVPGAVLAATRGYGPTLRKGDNYALTILNIQVLTTLLTAQAGGCQVIMDRNDAAGIAEWIRRERITLWNGPPALLYSLAHDHAVTPDDLASLEEVWYGGSDCPEPVRAAFAQKFSRPALASYGLTEAPTIVSLDPADGRHADGAAGQVMAHLRVEIVDGEICVGPATDGPWAGVYRPMLGYWERPEASEAALRDGLLHTGDLGTLDGDGFLHVRDRLSLVILRGSANVYPAEIERVLHELPVIEACAVVGVPDDRLGERVVAAIQLVPGAAITEAELAAHCRANLARYKVPEQWRFVDAFPRNSMGKIQRRELPELFVQ